MTRSLDIIRLKSILIGCLLIVCSSFSAQAEIFTHQLKFVKASQVIPVIKPHLAETTRLTAKDNILIANTTAEENQKLSQLLTMLDKQLANFYIEVRILNRKLDNWELAQSTTTIANPPVVKNSRYKTNDRSVVDKLFSLNLIETHQGFVQTGETFPEHQLVKHYQSFIPQTQSKKVTSGFFVTVNKNSDDNVILSVAAQDQTRNRQTASSTNQSSMATQFRAKLGDWTLVASNSQQANRSDVRSQKSQTYSTPSRDLNKRWYYIKVTQAKN